MEKVLQQYAALTKPGIVMGNLLAMVAGFAVASQGGWDVKLFVAAFVGLSFIIMSACVWNSYIDREMDAKMERTKGRPLVRGTVSFKSAKRFGFVLAASGTAVLLLYTNVLTTLIALFGFIIYVFGYSFSKYKFSEATFVGAIAGAVPPVVGYSAVVGKVDTRAFLLFLMMLTWQMPHFFAIAIYRIQDYERAGLPLLPILRGIKKTKITMVIYLVGFVLSALALSAYTLPITLAWLILGITGFTAKDDSVWARKMFLFSLIAVTFISLWLIVASFVK